MKSAPTHAGSALSLAPSGALLCLPSADAPLLPDHLAPAITAAFAVDTGHGLLHLGVSHVDTALPPVWAWWRDFAVRHVTALCGTSEEGSSPAPPEAEALARLVLDAPPMPGAEYLTTLVLATLWTGIGVALERARAQEGATVQAYLQARNPAWNLVGRVHFNLAENRKDPDAPFAFLATYTTQLSAHGTAQHLPLARALTEFAGARKKAQLLSLLKPLQRAAEACPWIAEMVESGEIYHPLRWQVSEAVRFLQDLPRLEAAGVIARMPAQWQAGRPPRPKVRATVGSKAPGGLGLEALLDFNLAVTLDGESLSAQELRAILAGSEGLQWIRGRWVEVDRKRLTDVLERMRAVEDAARTGLPFTDAMRLVAGAPLEAAAPDPDWAEVTAGPWFAETLRALRAPTAAPETGLKGKNKSAAGLVAVLRPYQRDGVAWLSFLTRLGLGACLADDMGLGKTLQVLALLVSLQQQQGTRPSLIVAPASLLANWMQEAQKFAPSLRCVLAHPSSMPRDALRALDAQALAKVDLVVTSYGTLTRVPVLAQVRWRIAVLDEAQAIKNPSTRQTRQVKKLAADARIALTGTPVENRLSDLWSIFDFTHPGLLGSEREFATFSKRLGEQGHYGPLRALVAPYILRRMKSDKRIIADLPDKTEVTAWCGLSTVQAAHYQAAVDALAHALSTTDGIERRGLVLAHLMRLKQICNHPSQWLNDGGWQEADSGKFARLREIAEIIAARQEKLLVFTQFRETTAPLAAFLGGVFGREGLVLHGGTPIARRRALVQRFQEDAATPFFVLSIKAGGSGLNLTAASHVVHFDRWWNPAVENQATDRAYRIGQHRNVLVHKFVCRGTIEERIDDLIRAKQTLVQEVVESGKEINLTELNDAELLAMVRLDIHAVEA